MKIPILCTGNSCLSQIARGFLVNVKHRMHMGFEDPSKFKSSGTTGYE